MYKDELELGVKFVLAVILIWPIYELRKLIALINYPRLSKFLNRIILVLWGFSLVRLLAGIVEYIGGFTIGWVSIIASILFFSITAFIMRKRRQQLAQEWAAVPESAPETYTNIISTLSDISKDANPHD